jgi:cobalt/nickel transport system permease protein
MHLGNSIICPVTGIPMIAVMGAAAVWSFKKARKDFTHDKILPTVMLTSLVFGLQMINFSIPTTASSGHIVGAILLSALLGPYVAFLSMCSILLIQSLFFADGGLLALGCNIFNMGFLACFAAYPIACKICKNKIMNAILASILALQLGSIAVTVESAISGSITNITMFAGLMCSIHFVISLVEGILTGAIVAIAQKTNLSRIFSYVTGTIALVLAGIISNYASTKPDGLEWSLLSMSDNFVAQTQGQIYAISEAIQTKTAILTSIPSVYANIVGLLIICLCSLIFFSLLSYKNVKE